MGSKVQLSFSHEHFPVCNVASSFFFMGVLFNLY